MHYSCESAKGISEQFYILLNDHTIMNESYLLLQGLPWRSSDGILFYSYYVYSKVGGYFCVASYRLDFVNVDISMKSHSWEQVNLLGSCFPVKGISYERSVIWSAVFEIKWRYDPRNKLTCWAHVFPWKEYRMKEVLYEVRCLKSNEDMILATNWPALNCVTS